ncbi:MAG: bifunctional glutamate N-acetyltransferase/amino-acid acetyltransferase ArgJ [Dehalococcoidia bacterium]|nr:bifunctional glutamate N-acetyltransferase/amino-acid acetyltransferase ArgJ [Dehalococcoidia bacterium]
MTSELTWLDDGGVTSPLGWQAGAVDSGVKSYGPQPRRDLAILASDRPAAVAGVFTRNRIVGPAVRLSRERVAGGVAQALVVNSGNANTVTGEQGERDALRMAALIAQRFGLSEQHVLIGSTGVIGRALPMQRIERGIAAVALSRTGGGEFARAIMTTDTVPKQHAVRFTAGGRAYIVGGTAKGSGMIHPDMATCFCFLTTDAPADATWLRAALRRVADASINMVDVDMDTSTSDTMLLFANGAGGGDPIVDGHPAAQPLLTALEAVAVALARALARDGEGATALIEVVVEGAATLDDARRAARTISASPLVKTMITGHDPNWGRVLMAIGRSGARVEERTTSVWIGEHCTLERGVPSTIDLALVSAAMDREEVRIRVDLGQGAQRATAWGCNMTAEYVHINAHYTT